MTLPDMVSWSSQPQVSVSPLPEWSCVFNPGVGWADLGKKVPSMAPLPSGGIKAGKNGKCYVFGATDASTTTGSIVPGILSGITSVIVLEHTASSLPSNFILAESAASTGAYNYGFYERSSGSMIFFIHNGTTGVYAEEVTSGTYFTTLNRTFVYAATYGDGDNNVRIYRDGILQQATPQTGNIQRNTAAHLSLMRWNTSTTACNFYAGAVMNKRMTANEIFKKFRTPETTYEALYGKRPVFPRILNVPAVGGVNVPVLYRQRQMQGMAA